MRIAVVGTGIAGLTAAHVLGGTGRHDVTVFEAEGRPGGHARTITVDVAGRRVTADTGFLVFNHRTYPGLTRLFAELGVESHPTDMSFSVADAASGLEYAGPHLRGIVARAANLTEPSFLGMLADVVRFHRTGRRLLAEGVPDDWTVGDLLADGRWSEGFRRWYLVPLAASLWSTDPDDVPTMSAGMLLTFFHRTGFLHPGAKPAWRTVTGGSARYVEAVLAPLRRAGRVRTGTPVVGIRRGDADVGGVEVRLVGRTEQFDHVVVATHADQALELLDNPTRAEKEILSAIRYRESELTVHTDTRVLPTATRAWAAWNHHVAADGGGRVSLTYHLNRLQGFRSALPLLVTLNRDHAVDPDQVVDRFRAAHPLLDCAAVAVQRRHEEIDGVDRLSFCGAYWGYGFHEDGLQSALRSCGRLGVVW